MSTEHHKTTYEKEKRKMYYLLVVLVFAIALFWYANHNYSTNFTETLTSST